ncbi:MAG: type II toxin-antitoxin system HicB family antitoxin [Magnetococcales bacterium]|nr:type II toxin-antitoxin system HicB family antitoxin [Magnetococcales bacterium]
MRYPFLLKSQSPPGFFVRFPDLDDTFTEGETEEQAIRNAVEVLTAMLGWRLDQGYAIPEPSQEVTQAAP